ncbi:putative nuclease HARBI1, partial [Carassius carassius]|uniref:putative nuclease HARBI1 n=1 Tax=Carassius carassius TaxID=217509 RepID=UPI0028687736
MKAQNCVFLSALTMACPFLRDVVDEEALVLRRAFRRERVFRDRLDPLAFPDDHLYERYRFSADGIRYLCRLLGPRIKHRTARSHALSVEQMVCVALRFFASGAFLYSVGDAEQLNKATICRTIRSVCLAIKALADVFSSFPGHRRLCNIEEEFYWIAGFPNVIGAVDCTHIRIKAPSGAHEADFVNRKSFHSINVQMVCNADCVISNVVAKLPGSVHDSRIFRASEIYQCLSQGIFVFVTYFVCLFQHPEICIENFIHESTMETFQHDNAKPHTAAITTAWLRRRRVRVLTWPACSPDLSPIENIWHIIKRKIR